MSPSAAAEAKPIVIQTGDTTFYRFDPQLGFWGGPGISRAVRFEQYRPEPIVVSHNSRGNRDREFEPRPDERPVVCFGGSHTWGAGVERESRYTDRLEERLGRRVLNLGHCSLGLDQICLALLRWVGTYRPSVVVVEQYPWAIHRVLNNYVNGYVKPYFYLEAQDSLRLRKVAFLARFPFFRRIIGAFYAYKKELREFRAGIDLKEGYDPSADPIFLSWKTPHYDEMYRLVRGILAVLRDVCNKNGARLLFALGAVQQQFGAPSRTGLVDYELPQKRLRTILDELGIAWVDMTEPMRREHTAKDPVIFPDGHLCAKGHGVFARVLEAEFRKREWVSG